MDGEDGEDSGISIAADSFPAKKARKAVKKVKKEILDEEKVEAEKKAEDEGELGRTPIIKAIAQAKIESVDGGCCEDEARLTVTIKAEEDADELTTATKNDGQTAEDDAVSESITRDELVKNETTAAPDISADILSHLAVHKSMGLTTAPSLLADTTALGEDYDIGLDTIPVIAPFGYGKLSVSTQDATASGEHSPVSSIYNAHEADLAVNEFVEQLDAESREVAKCEQRHDEKLVIA